MPPRNPEFRDFFARRRQREEFVQRPTHFRHLDSRRIKIEKRTAATSAVKAFANQFPTTFAGIKQMVDAIAGFELVHIPPIARRAYAQRTADDIISTRTIPTSYGMVKKGIKALAPDVGCADLCDALIACLRHKGVEARHVRTVAGLFDRMRRHALKPEEVGKRENFPHSYARFSFEGREYLADPFRRYPVERMIELNPRQKAFLDSLAEKGLLREGRDLWDSKIGIYSYADYVDEVHRLRKRHKRP